VTLAEHLRSIAAELERQHRALPRDASTSRLCLDAAVASVRDAVRYLPKSLAREQVQGQEETHVKTPRVGAHEPAAGSEVAAAVPPPAAGTPAPAPPGRKPCKVCGGTDHDARRHNGRRATAAPPVESPATDDEDPEPAAAAAPSVGRGRGVRHCRRCHQPGHITRNCDADLTDARVQDIAAACARLGLAPPSAPRVVPMVESASPPPSSAAWDRSDPEQDLTELDLGVSPEEATAAPALGPMLVTPPPPVEALVEVLPDAAPTPPALLRARQKLAARAGDVGQRAGTRNSVTIGGALTQDEINAGRAIMAPDGLERPRTRGECGQVRPCPWVSCSMHLYLDVTPVGTLALNHPAVDVWNMNESCALDVADRGPQILEDIAAVVGGFARERIRQIEDAAMEKLRRSGAANDIELPPEHAHSPLGEVMD
jgi:hypothetical protein